MDEHLFDVNDFIQQYYDIALVPKYKDYGKSSKLIPKSKNQKKENHKDNEKKEENKQEEFKSTYIQPGVYFNKAWLDPNKWERYKYDNGDTLTFIPDVYNFNIYKSPIDSIFDATKYLVDAITLNENGIRVNNMKKSNMDQFFSTSPKKVIGAMNAAGDFIIPFSPQVGIAFKTPGYFEDVVSTIYNPYSYSNWVELGLDGFDAYGLTKALTGKAPMMNVVYPKWWPNFLKPGGTYSFRMIRPTKSSVTNSAISNINDIPQIVTGESGLEHIKNLIK